jgi:triacylglycerol lipase
VSIDGKNIRLYSWGGGSPFTHALDPSDYLFATTSLAFGGQANDGVTGVCSNHFGQIIQDRYRMNHIDINNHVLGLVSWFESNPKTVFKNHATRLKQAGL